jgi:hypothetical protein
MEDLSLGSEPVGSTTGQANPRESVKRALASVERGERNALEGLREALCGFVVELRKEGASRDEAIAAVRELMTEPATAAGMAVLLPPAREALVELSTYWCAQEYARE